MAIELRPDRQKWHRITKALLVGYVVLLVFSHQALGDALDWPMQATQLVIWGASLGAVSFMLLRYELEIGYLLAISTGLLGIASWLLLPDDALSPSPDIGIVFGLVEFPLFELFLIASAYLARRDRDETANGVVPDDNVAR
jgi:hypothetical protein